MYICILPKHDYLRYGKGTDFEVTLYVYVCADM